MKREKEYGGITNRKITMVKYLYVGAMLLVYLSYILIDNYRLHQSEKWQAIENLTLEDVQTIQQFASLNANFEWLFISLFIMGVLLSLYKKNKEKLAHFILLNVCFFAALFLMSYLLSFFLKSPLGNLTQPLFIPIIILVGLMFYWIFIFLKQRFSRSV